MELVARFENAQMMSFFRIFKVGAVNEKKKWVATVFTNKALVEMVQRLEPILLGKIIRVFSECLLVVVRQTV